MLARIALRMAAVQALKGKTQVGDNVYDSRIGALDIAADGSMRTAMDRPFIAIYTDGAKAEGADLNIRNLGVNGLTELLFETGVSITMTDTDPETGASTVISGIPAADEAFEFLLDIVARQIMDALTAPDDAWADIFRSMIIRIEKVERARASSDDGTPMAAQQIKMTVELLDDPAFGEPLDDDVPFARFLAKLDAMPMPYPVYATLMRAQIAGSDKPWKAIQRRLGMTQAELLALGLGPIAGDIDRSTPPFAIGTVEVAGSGTAFDVEDA